MSNFGKSIKIYLKDGSVTGVKFAEVINQTIQGICCPRLRTVELNDLPEAKKPGVYLLFGQDEETNEPKVYIGEAENVYDRLQNHVANKDFWNEVIFFVSKDDYINKAHIKYLESRIIQISSTINRYKIDNYNQPQLTSLSLSDRDAMEEFLIYIKLLLGILGHKILEDIKNSITIIDNGAKKIDNQNNIESALPLNNLELYLTVSGLNARGLQTDEGIVVLEGSEASKTHTINLSQIYVDIRERLINNSDLTIDGEKYIFKKDVLFNSPSRAAAVIVGYNINGPQNWKNKLGISLKEIEKQRLVS